MGDDGNGYVGDGLHHGSNKWFSLNKVVLF